MESSFLTTTDVSDMKKLINEIYDASKKSFLVHEKTILNEINAIKKEQSSFYNKIMDLLSKNDSNSSNNTNNNDSNIDMFCRTLTDVKACHRKPKSKSPITRSPLIINQSMFCSNTTTSNKGVASLGKNNESKKSFYLNKKNKYNEILPSKNYSPTKPIGGSPTRKNVKHKINVNSNNNNTNSTNKKKNMNKTSSFLNRCYTSNNNNNSNSNTILLNKRQSNDKVSNYNNSNNNKTAITKLSKTSLHKNTHSTELICINNDIANTNTNSNNTNNDCMVLNTNKNSTNITNQKHIELRKLSIIDIPFSISTKINQNTCNVNNNNEIMSFVETDNNNNNEILNDSFSLNNSNITLKVISLLIKSEILPLKEKAILSTLNKTIYQKYPLGDILYHYIFFLNKQLIITNNQLNKINLFIPSISAQILLKFISPIEENEIYNNNNNNNSIMKLINIICERSLNDKPQTKINELLLHKATLENISKMNITKSKQFIDLYESNFTSSVSNNNNKHSNNVWNSYNGTNEHKKILFYINEVYVYIKIKYDLNIKKEYIQLQHKKYQELEIVHKLKK